MGRRGALATLSLGAAAAVTLPGRAHAAAMTQTERANVDVVNAFCAEWSAPLDLPTLVSFLADDCVYRATETTPPATGHAAIIERVQSFLGNATFVEYEVLDTFARGAIVVNERIDRATLPGRSIEWRGVGVFYLKDGAIAEWSDFTIAVS